MNLIGKKAFNPLLLSGIVLLLAVGCRDNPLDVTPNGQITLAAVFADENHTEAFLNTTYTFVPNYFFSYGNTMIAGATDEAQYNYGPASGWNLGNLTPSQNNLNNNYANFWKGIRYANIFLVNIDQATISSEANRSRLRSEARMLRAFYYLELVKQYGPMPIVETDFTAGYDFSGLTRPSFQDNIDFIVRDCDEAISNPNLPLRFTVEGDRGRFSKAVAYIVKSQALLYNASPLWNPTNDLDKWRAASVASNEALDALTAGGQYHLADNYGEYFLSQADLNSAPRDRETIYETRISSSIEVVTTNNIPSKLGIVYAGAGPTQELVDSYEMQATGELGVVGYQDEDHLQPIINTASGYQENNPYVGRDPRFYATIWYNGASYDNINGNIHTVETFVGGQDQIVSVSSGILVNTVTGYYLRKFVDPKLQPRQNSDARWKKYRLAELYLNFAEAQNELSGPNANVYAAVNEIRSRAQMPSLPEGLNQPEMRERIRRERRVELAFEEHRFWDVRRWRILEETGKVSTAMQITKHEDSFSYSRIVSDRRNAWQERFLIYPIPFSDVKIIRDFEENQNPGW